MSFKLSAPLRSVLHATLAVATAMLLPSLASADSTSGSYQAPDFDTALFDPDAVSLQGVDVFEVVEALTALVRNFNSVPNIDTDLKEKAMAVALRLDPLNPVARAAHRQMMMTTDAGESSVAYESILSFSDSVKVFEVLRPHAERLSRKRAQPDDEVLGPLLMEIALTVLSKTEWQTPEAQGLAQLFSEVGGEGELNQLWAKVVSLQPIPGDGASLLASRMAALKREGQEGMSREISENSAPAPAPVPAASSTSAVFPSAAVGLDTAPEG